MGEQNIERLETYREWALSKFEKSELIDLDDEQIRDKIKMITGMLLRKMNKIFYKEYGKKHTFFRVWKKYTTLEEEGDAFYEIQKKGNNRLREIEETYTDRLNEIKQSENDNCEKRQKKLAEKSRKSFEDKKRKLELYPVGDRQRFEYLTQSDKEVFDFIYDICSKKRQDVFKKTSYTIEVIKQRQEFFELICNVRNKDDWDFEYLQFLRIQSDLLYPALYEFWEIFTYYEEKKTINEKCFEKIRSIQCMISCLDSEFKSDEAYKVLEKDMFKNVNDVMYNLEKTQLDLISISLDKLVLIYLYINEIVNNDNLEQKEIISKAKHVEKKYFKEVKEIQKKIRDLYQYMMNELNGSTVEQEMSFCDTHMRNDLVEEELSESEKWVIDIVKIAIEEEKKKKLQEEKKKKLQ